MVNSSREALVCMAFAALIGVVSVGRADIDPRTGRQLGGDAAPQNFAQYCQGELPRDRLSTFNAELARAEGALAAGNGDQADDALLGAFKAIFRGGAEDSALSVKCLGEQTARRWFNAKLAVWRVVSGDRRLEQSSRGNMRYLLAANANPDSTAKLIKGVAAERFKPAYRAVREAVQMIESEREYGAFILREEEQIQANGREVLGSLSEFAAREAAAALKAEDAAFRRPITPQERQALQALGGAGQLAAAMAGMELDVADQEQAMITGRQVDESREMLRRARAYELDAGAPAPSDRRAEMRGDTMIARADDKAHGLELRDTFYDMARDYFEFCRCDDKVAAAEAAQQRIQPALQAERDRREQQMEKTQAELQQKADAMQRDIEKMQKTDAEKKSFQEEADALEAELGF